MKVISLVCFLILISSCVPGVGSKGEIQLKNSSNAKDSSSGVSLDNRVASLAAFKSTVYPIVQNRCSQCHGDAQKNSPFFALESLYERAHDNMLGAGKVNLGSPSRSRIYLRLKDDLHNCWGECKSNAEEMLSAIILWKQRAGESDNGGNVRTVELPFPLDTRFPQTDFGTIILDAEQDSGQAVFGRYNVHLDSLALGGKYISDKGISLNPSTDVTRTSVIRDLGCRPPTAAEVDTYGIDNGQSPFRITEGNTFPSHAQSPDGLKIKNGHVPYTLQLRAVVIRPDRRLQYAKDLRDNNYQGLGRYQSSTVNGPGNNDEIGTTDYPDSGNNPFVLNITSILPHFASVNDVFEETSGTRRTFKNSLGDFQKADGSTGKLHDLFATPFFTAAHTTIVDYLESAPALQGVRQKMVYPQLRLALEDVFSLSGSSRGKYGFYQIGDMTFEQSLALILETPKVDSACRKDCLYNIVSINNQAINFSNALDWMKVSNDGTNIEITRADSSGTITQANSSGGQFRRIDLYVRYTVDSTTRTVNPANVAVNYKIGENSFQSDAETFSTDNGLTYTFTLSGNGDSGNIDLRAIYVGAQNELSRADNISNYQETLYPFLRQQYCISCHSEISNNANAPKFLTGNIESSFSAIINKINFQNPANSLRAINTPGASLIHNYANRGSYITDPQDIMEAKITDLIRSWGEANDRSIQQNADSKIHRSLTSKEITPGHTRYDFIVTEAGPYNLWLRYSSPGAAGTVNYKIVKVKDSQERDIAPRSVASYRGANNPVDNNFSANDNCHTASLPQEDSFSWWAEGRSTERARLTSLGLPKESDGESVETLDGRRYFDLDQGTYQIQLYQTNGGQRVGIDALAIDLVEDKEKLLEFQPDLRAAAIKNISNYKRHILRYDVSDLVNLPKESSFFEIEVEASFENQNYIFRNPRMISPRKNIRIRDIKIHINKFYSFTDNTFTKINYVTGAGRTMTYAPLVALNEDREISADTFSVSFDLLTQSEEALSKIDPRAAEAQVKDNGKCRRLGLFTETIRPLLRQARIVLKDDYQQYLEDFPGNDRQNTGSMTFYRCINCHTQDHPYFKMTTFDYPEVLCQQALSRVNLSNYFDSLIFHGIDGAGEHPKFYFAEEFKFSANDQNVEDFARNYNGDWQEYSSTIRASKGFIENHLDADNGGRSIASSWLPRQLLTYTQSDLGLDSNNSYSQADKAYLQEFLGEFKAISYRKLPDFSSPPYSGFYIPYIHDKYSGNTRTVGDFIVEDTVVNDTIVTPGSYVRADNQENLYTLKNPVNFLANKESFKVSDVRVNATGGNSGRTIALNITKIPYQEVEQIQREGNQKDNKVYVNNYTYENEISRLENLKRKYRFVIMKWIQAEHACFLDPSGVECDQLTD